MLSTLVAKHNTGLFVLAASSEFSDHPARPMPSTGWSLWPARPTASWLSISARALTCSALRSWKVGRSFYLIAQVGITELLNANRMISKFFFTRDDSLQIVLNRFKPSDLLFDEKKDCRGAHAARAVEDP